jgi:hypothetical protein
LTDTNPTRTRYAHNREAFVEVFGDPTAADEETPGYYNSLRVRSSIRAAKNNFDEGRGTSNPARPNVIDFCCDVESAIKSVIKERNLLIKFQKTYINDFITDTQELKQEERIDLEQRIGRLLLVRGISPVARYFTSIRK